MSTNPQPAEQLLLPLQHCLQCKVLSDFAVLVNDAHTRCSDAEWQDDVLTLYQRLEIICDGYHPHHRIWVLNVTIHRLTREILEEPQSAQDQGHRFNRLVPESDTMQNFSNQAHEIFTKWQGERAVEWNHVHGLYGEPSTTLFEAILDGTDESTAVLALYLMVGRKPNE